MFKEEGSFARKQLEKHGWTEGAGLGSREHGISEAIKVKIKHDSKGVGHKASKEFTHHWWDHAFNKSASSISVEEGEDGVVVTKKTKTKKQRTEVAKQTLYGNFVKGSLLTNGTEETLENEDKDSSDEEESVEKQTLMLPEDVLFQRCGGRTAHKGARHGLKASGKLARVEAQEQLLLEKYRRAALPAAPPGSAPAKEGLSHPARTQSHASQETTSSLSSSPQLEDPGDESDVSSSSKLKSKKKKKKRDREEDNGVKPGRDDGLLTGDDCDISSSSEVRTKKKKKKKKREGGEEEMPEDERRDDSLVTDNGNNCDSDGQPVAKKRKKKNKKSKT